MPSFSGGRPTSAMSGSVYGRGNTAYGMGLMGTQNAMDMAQGMQPMQATATGYTPMTTIGMMGAGAQGTPQQGVAQNTTPGVPWYLGQDEVAAHQAAQRHANAMLGRPADYTGTTSAASNMGAPATGGAAPGGSNIGGAYVESLGPGARAQGYGYDAATMAAPEMFRDADLSGYMNPYTQAVVDQTTADMNRARQMQIMQDQGRATAAGAFGGARHGVMDAETNRGFYDRLGATTGALRNQGFEAARDSFFQDVGNQMEADAFNASAVNQARQVGANNRTSASGQNAGLLAQMALGRMDAVNRDRQFNAGVTNDASRFNASLDADTSRFNAGQTNAMQSQQVNDVLRAASQMADQGALGFDMGNTVADRQWRQGAASRAMQQAVLDAALAQFQNFTGQGQQSIQPLIQLLQATRASESSSTGERPGLLSQIAGFL